MYEESAADDLARLGLAPGADARAIRRAYARELKKIDQAADADGFQALRAAYEAALANDGVAEDLRSPQGDLPDDAGVAPVARTAPAAIASGPDTPDQLAEAAAAAFTVVVASLAARHGGASDTPFEDALRTALADDRLFGLEARMAFEWQVAGMLAEGWQPGHDALLGAAASVFGWSHGAHLGSLGFAGAVVDQALTEYAMFVRQPIVEKQAQKRILMSLRRGHRPAPGSVMQDLPFFARMQTRFPNWLQIVAPQAGLDYWTALGAAPETLMAPPEQASWWLRIVVAGLCLVAIMQYAGQAALSPVLATAPAADQAPSRERVDDLMARVDAALTAAHAAPALQATFDVVLDDTGQAVQVDRIDGAGAGDAAVDAAVRTAILRSAPFPAETSRQFRLTLGQAPQSGAK